MSGITIRFCIRRIREAIEHRYHIREIDGDKYDRLMICMDEIEALFYHNSK